jgi:hypothetical protein
MNGMFLILATFLAATIEGDSGRSGSDSRVALHSSRRHNRLRSSRRIDL